MILLFVLILSVPATLLGAWMFMLTVGVMHGEWLTMMPTIGYWSAVKTFSMLSMTAGTWLSFRESAGRAMK